MAARRCNCSAVSVSRLLQAALVRWPYAQGFIRPSNIERDYSKKALRLGEGLFHWCDLVGHPAEPQSPLLPRIIEGYAFGTSGAVVLPVSRLQEPWAAKNVANDTEGCKKCPRGYAINLVL